MSKLDELFLRFVTGARRLRTESGQTLAEYSLVVTLVAVGVTLLALFLFRTALADAFTGVTGCLTGSC